MRKRVLTLSLVSLAALFMAGITPAAAALPPSMVFINEVHYDNNGPDAGEFIEIAGPAGTNLAGWTLQLYNGSVGAVYSSTALSGTLSDQSDGYGTTSISYQPDGIQNGAPDGIALVSPTGQVIQFLSYEGTFTATSGAAAGMTSENIGVSETGAEPAGWSLQLQGAGNSSDDFVWAGPIANTQGGVNTGQIFQSGPTDLDGDAVPDALDNCPLVANADQKDIDRDGAGDACDSIDDRTADQQLADLIAELRASPVGPGGSYLAKLQTIATSIGAGNEQAACNQLAAFRNEVRAQSGKKLSVTEAELLIVEATAIAAKAGCT